MDGNIYLTKAEQEAWRHVKTRMPMYTSCQDQLQLGLAGARHYLFEVQRSSLNNGKLRDIAQGLVAKLLYLVNGDVQFLSGSAPNVRVIAEASPIRSMYFAYLRVGAGLGYWNDHIEWEYILHSLAHNSHFINIYRPDLARLYEVARVTEGESCTRCAAKVASVTTRCHVCGFYKEKRRASVSRM